MGQFMAILNYSNLVRFCGLQRMNKKVFIVFVLKMMSIGIFRLSDTKSRFRVTFFKDLRNEGLA